VSTYGNHNKISIGNEGYIYGDSNVLVSHAQNFMIYGYNNSIKHNDQIIFGHNINDEYMADNTIVIGKYI
jgi:hypothetical protein